MKVKSRKFLSPFLILISLLAGTIFFIWYTEKPYVVRKYEVNLSEAVFRIPAEREIVYKVKFRNKMFVIRNYTFPNSSAMKSFVETIKKEG